MYILFFQTSGWGVYSVENHTHAEQKANTILQLKFSGLDSQCLCVCVSLCGMILSSQENRRSGPLSYISRERGITYSSIWKIQLYLKLSKIRNPFHSEEKWASKVLSPRIFQPARILATAQIPMQTKATDATPPPSWGGLPRPVRLSESSRPPHDFGALTANWSGEKDKRHTFAISGLSSHFSFRQAHPRSQLTEADVGTIISRCVTAYSWYYLAFLQMVLYKKDK